MKVNMEKVWEAFKAQKRVKENLEKAGIDSITSILAVSDEDLNNIDLTLVDIEKLRKVAKPLASFPQRLTALLNVQHPTGPRWWKRRLSSGCQILDKFLRGGFPARGILELSGESGSGKTQICLQAAVSAQIPSTTDGTQSLGTIYICTEDTFPSKRLMQIIENFQGKHPEIKGSIGNRIFIEHVPDLSTLKDCLQVRMPHLLRTSKVPFGLIVVDSITGVFRGSTDKSGSDTILDEHGKCIASDIRSRAVDLKELAGELHSLSSTYGLTVICVNQVSDAIDGIRGFGCNNKVPALGLSWANMVTTRLIASRTENYINSDTRSIESNPTKETTLIRELEVIFSPELPPSKCRYIITQSGVFGIT